MFAGDSPATGSTPCASYRELVELDHAQSARWARPVADPVPVRADPMDLEILELIARLGHVLTSQLHRRFSPARTIATMQRRLKRLSDAGLAERFRFYRRDGGAMPICYVASQTGRELLRNLGRLDAPPTPGGRELQSSPPRRRDPDGDDRSQLRHARHDVHVAGFVIALMEMAADSRSAIRGRAESVLSPPRTGAAQGGAPLGPARLRLPDGRVPHDFLRPAVGDRFVEVEQFETIRPDATLELAGRGIDVMVELDDRLPVGGDAARLLRYDHFLSGWSAHLPRYDERHRAEPLLVFVCRDRSRARLCAQLADAALLACRAYPGEYPQDWDYVGRARTLFVSERDVHEGLDHAYGVPRVPPALRVRLGGGDPAAAEPAVEPRALLGGDELAR